MSTFDLKVYDDGFKPAEPGGQKPGLETLPDGDYEIAGTSWKEP